MSASRKFWIIGLALAGTGVVLVRLVSPALDEAVPRLVVYFLGITVALAGLGVIMYGIRKGSRPKS
ncbi:MAG: hypothetical protein PHU08_02150 [Dehalococcoidales bacterium]|nr:hypothetical protein [Dehalococcoidales bacterium]